MASSFSSSSSKSNTTGTQKKNTTSKTTNTSTSSATGSVNHVTKDNYNRFNNGYTQSPQVQQAYANLQTAIDVNKPNKFYSPYTDIAKGIYDRVLGGEKFNFDVNKSELYQGLRNSYEVLGKLSAADTQKQAEQLTGGYDSSYAGTVGQQGYQQYVQGLNDQIPSIYNMDMQTWQANRDDLYGQLNAANQMRANEYGEYRNAVADYQADRDYALGQYQSDRDFDYGKYKDARDFWADEYWRERNAEITDKGKQTEDNTTEITDNENTTETAASSSQSISGGGGGGGRSGGRRGSGSSSAEYDASGTTGVISANAAGLDMRTVTGVVSDARRNSTSVLASVRKAVGGGTITAAQGAWIAQNYPEDHSRTASVKSGYATKKGSKA